MQPSWMVWVKRKDSIGGIDKAPSPEQDNAQLQIEGAITPRLFEVGEEVADGVVW